MPGWWMDSARVVRYGHIVVRWTARAAAVLALCWTLLLGRQPARAAHGDGTAAASARRVVAYFPTYARDYGYDERSIDFSVVTVMAHGSPKTCAHAPLVLRS